MEKKESEVKLEKDNNEIEQEQVVSEAETNENVVKEEDQITILNEKIKELEFQLLKNQADLENFKRRTYEERIKERKYALQGFLSELINTVDIFDRAVSVKTDDEKLSKFLSGFSMVNMTFKQLLDSYEVKKIDSVGKTFDSNVHQAVETVNVSDYESGVVVEEVMSGYTYKDRVLRPSLVKVNE